MRENQAWKGRQRRSCRTFGTPSEARNIAGVSLRFTTCLWSVVPLGLSFCLVVLVFVLVFVLVLILVMVFVFVTEGSFRCRRPLFVIVFVFVFAFVLKSYQHFLLGDFRAIKKFLEADIANRSCLFGENKGLF